MKPLKLRLRFSLFHWLMMTMMMRVMIFLLCSSLEQWRLFIVQLSLFNKTRRDETRAYQLNWWKGFCLFFFRFIFIKNKNEEKFEHRELCLFFAFVFLLLFHRWPMSMRCSCQQSRTVIWVDDGYRHDTIPLMTQSRIDRRQNEKQQEHWRRMSRSPFHQSWLWYEWSSFET